MSIRIGISSILLGAALLSVASAQPATQDKPKSEQPKAEQAKPDVVKPDAAKPDAAKPDAAKPDAPAAARETPPDVKAFQDVLKITDPEKKIEALNKFKVDFPNSPTVGSVNSNILSTLAQKMPKQESRIRGAAQAMYDAATSKGPVSGQIADTLLSAGILLEDAQKYAEISLLSLDQGQYLKDQKASAERRKATPLSEEEMLKNFQKTRAPRLSLMGRIELELGHSDRGKKLLEDAYAITPDSSVIASALGELAAKAGDQKKALEYLITARLAGKMSASAMASLNTAYKKTHEDSLNGLEALLDSEYHKRFPNPLHLDEYKDTDKRSNRLVLAEVFTGSGCPPCVGADLAFEAAMERYNRKDLMVVMYHEHVPQPDPMTNPDTQARSKFYEVKGVPTYTVDGKAVDYNGAGREGTKDVYSHLQKFVEADLEAAAEAQLKVDAKLSGNSVAVKFGVSDVKTDLADLKVHVLLLEKELRYSGENGIRFHPMVVRAMGGDNDEGFALASNTASFSQAWDLDKVSAGLKAHLDDYEAKGHRGNPFTFIEKKYQIDHTNLAVVVFVQNAKTKHILQSSYVDLGTAPAPAAAAEGQKEQK